MRLHTAIKLGYNSLKYLSEINLCPNKASDYWEDLGFECFAGLEQGKLCGPCDRARVTYLLIRGYRYQLT